MSSTAHVFAKYQEMIEISTIRTLISLDIFDALSLHQELPKTLAELEQITGSNRSLLQRLLRVVISTGLLNLNPKDHTYSHTDISRGYCGGTLSTDFFILMHDEVLKPAVLMAEWIHYRGRRTEPAGIDSHLHSPATFRNGNDGMTLFEIMSKDPERQKNFHAGMSAMAKLHPYQGVYDFRRIIDLADLNPDRTTIVDVGGGNGAFFANLAKEYPRLSRARLVIQDIPEVIEVARANPQLPKNVYFQTHDFQSPQPVQHAIAYHIRACLHDYGDEHCVRIMSQIVRAMALDSVLLIEENIMPEKPEFGEAIAFADMTMMVCGGRERTRKDWECLIDQAGLKINSINAAIGLTWAMIVTSLKTVS